jgi:hypothetical protein
MRLTDRTIHPDTLVRRRFDRCESALSGGHLVIPFAGTCLASGRPIKDDVAATHSGAESLRECVDDHAADKEAICRWVNAFRA